MANRHTRIVEKARFALRDKVRDTNIICTFTTARRVEKFMNRQIINRFIVSSQRVRSLVPAFVDKNSTHAATIEVATIVKI